MILDADQFLNTAFIMQESSLHGIIYYQFYNIVSAICYTIITEKKDSLLNTDINYNNKAVNFVMGQYQRMPDFLRIAIFLITFFFDFTGIVYGRVFFHQQNSSIRQKQIEIWRNSPLGFCQDFVKFYESLTIFAYYNFNKF